MRSTISTETRTGKTVYPFELIRANVDDCLQLAKKEETEEGIQHFITLAEHGIRMLELFMRSYKKIDFRFSEAGHIYEKGVLVYLTECKTRLYARDGEIEELKPFNIYLGRDVLKFYLNGTNEDLRQQQIEEPNF